MLEIFALIHCSRKIKEIALEKGENTTKWIVIMIFSWISAEVFGIFLVMILMGGDGFFFPIIAGLACGVGSFFLIQSFLSKKPTKVNELNDIGKNEKPNLDHFR